MTFFHHTCYSSLKALSLIESRESNIFPLFTHRKRREMHNIKDNRLIFLSVYKSRVDVCAVHLCQYDVHFLIGVCSS